MVLLNLFHNQGRGRPIGGGQSYAQKVLSYNPTAYWPLWETSGGIAVCQVNSAQNGTYVGATLADSLGPDNVNNAPLFDGTNDYVDIDSVALDLSFNGSEGTAMIWSKVFNAGVWTDSAFRTSYTLDGSDSRVYAYKSNVNDTYKTQYKAGGTTRGWSESPITYTNWFHLCITWSATEDETKTFINGDLLETDTVLGIWAGALSPALIGAFTLAPAEVWYGWLSHMVILGEALSDTAVVDLATV